MSRAQQPQLEPQHEGPLDVHLAHAVPLARAPHTLATHCLDAHCLLNDDYAACTVWVWYTPRWVDVSVNMISGSLPAEIGNVNNVEVMKTCLLARSRLPATRTPAACVCVHSFSLCVA